MASSRAGKSNYNNELLLLIMQAKMPTCTLEWAEVAEQYKARSGEHLLRTVIQLKKHWNSKLCLNFKAVTGNNG